MIDLIFSLVLIIALLYVFPYFIFGFCEFVDACFDWMLDKLDKLIERKNNESNTNTK